MSYELGKDLVKGIANLVKKTKDKNVASELIAIQTQVNQMQQDIFELQNENYELKKQISEFDNYKEIEKRIARNNGDAADYTDENGNSYVICTTCWDNNRKIVQAKQWGSKIEFHCGVCKAPRFKVNK
jgi:TolA-binding protein